ncbi:hypothetical protein HOLleu_39968 [Holothuria leucospilota]|uniref:Uncharacterized protein n=1 Tax=Holothuria leucospilota TaxID=206669 RepID=A0A9Q1BCF7_HOLLE|nr:hypothetical protein HOLleu_39968 [Holothuria leucospilota]
MKDFDLKDIWRELSHNNYRYTWKSNSDPLIYCRLDYFLISFSLVNTVKSCEILAGLISDHNPITLSFESCFSGRGPGYWKLNVSLIKQCGLCTSNQRCCFSFLGYVCRLKSTFKMGLT